MNENMILEEWKKSLEFQNVYFTFCVKSFDKGRLRKVANVFSIQLLLESFEEFPKLFQNF